MTKSTSGKPLHESPKVTGEDQSDYDAMFDQILDDVFGSNDKPTQNNQPNEGNSSPAIAALGKLFSQPPQQEVEATRGLLDSLLTQSRLYHTSADYMALLDFVVRLRNFAPFNAMLLQVQKPGLRYAASEADWRAKFGRKPKVGARPLLILWPFGPVALVYDVMDTEGKELPQESPLFMRMVRLESLKSHISEIEQAAEIFNGMTSMPVTQRRVRSDASSGPRKPASAIRTGYS